MFGLGLPEIIVILVIVLIVFGVGRLPEIGSGLGKAIRGFKKGMTEPNEIDQDSRKDSSNDKKS
jgi:sec-independent protein translocase protein TatA